MKRKTKDEILKAALQAIVLKFARALLHGDEVHQAWILEAAHNFNAGKPLPPPRNRLDVGIKHQ